MKKTIIALLSLVLVGAAFASPATDPKQPDGSRIIWAS